jgi:hypothetical protein
MTEMQRLEAAFTQTQADLETEIAELEQRRDALSDQVAAAETQRGQLQSQVTEIADTLAARSEQLASLEAQIQTAQSGAAAEAEGLQPGRYITRLQSGSAITAEFTEDGSFSLWRGLTTGEDTPEPAVAGSYVIVEDTLTFEDASGTLGTAQFPMNCTLTDAASGFVLSDSEDQDANPCALADLDFVRLN